MLRKRDWFEAPFAPLVSDGAAGGPSRISAGSPVIADGCLGLPASGEITEYLLSLH
jgi:hypothetical protein